MIPGFEKFGRCRFRFINTLVGFKLMAKSDYESLNTDLEFSRLSTKSWQFNLFLNS